MSNPESNEIFMKIHLSEQESTFSKLQNKIKNIIYINFLSIIKIKIKKNVKRAKSSNTLKFSEKAHIYFKHIKINI